MSASKGRYLHTEKTHTDIHASRGFEPTISVFVRTKTIHALDGETTEIGALNVMCGENTKFYTVKSCGTYTGHCALKG
jgi:hypothetical protein